MKLRRVLGFVAMMVILPIVANAGGKEKLQEYFNDAAVKVKATDDPSEKRRILNESLETMTKALDMVQLLPSISKEDVAGIDRFRSMLQEKQDELAGRNGFAQVSDAQLNVFSDYVVQDMEQAEQVVTISLVTLLLIIVIIILLV